MASNVDDERFRIFISHKHEDHILAKHVKEALEELARDRTYRIECFVSGSDIPAGADWNAVLRSELARSHMLVLLFTTPSRSWDWCLYEAGLFARFDPESPRSVICLYAPDSSPPAPLQNLQGVKVTKKRVETFLTRLCEETWEVADDWRRGPLHEGVDDERIESSAEKIWRNFESGTYAYHPCHRVVLDLSNVEKVDETIPADARVVEGPNATSAFTLSIFGVGEGERKRTWDDLLESIGGHEAEWL